jgi:aryl-alcohol dehydrogenase-like predicted oxidoreductase
MEYRKLGNSGLKVSEIGLGGDTFGWWADEQTSITVINHALDLGINFIDTANSYGGQGQSEEFIGKAVKGKRSQVLIATKFRTAMGEGPNESGGSRHHIMGAVDASLRRLNTDYIDLYQIHYPDPTSPIEETLRALDDLVHAGKVRYIGCSNFTAWQLCEALWISKVNNLQSFITEQPQYNLIDRHIEQELVPCCQAYGIGVIPYFPLAAGFLTGKYRRGEAPPAGTRFNENPSYTQILSDANFDKLDKLQAFTSQRGHSVTELAIAWLLSHPWVSTVIPGARKIEQVSANMAAAEWKLTASEVAQLEKIS